MKELVFGHKNPDTDAIVAAKAYAFLQNALGNEVEAVALGTPNEETKFVLEHFEEPAPRVIEKATPEVEAVMLVDHNEEQQSVADIADVTVHLCTITLSQLAVQVRSFTVNSCKITLRSQLNWLV